MRGGVRAGGGATEATEVRVSKAWARLYVKREEEEEEGRGEEE